MFCLDLNAGTHRKPEYLGKMSDGPKINKSTPLSYYVSRDKKESGVVWRLESKSKSKKEPTRTKKKHNDILTCRSFF